MGRGFHRVVEDSQQFRLDIKENKEHGDSLCSVYTVVLIT